jgi:spermidine/putrescine transport system ATP-binding protein
MEEEQSEVPLLELVGITKDFGETKVLKGINLKINSNEFVTLLGPSGCGKTTTLRIIGGFETPTSGQVMFQGKDITSLPPYERSTNTVFQSYALFPHLDVYDNIAFGLRLHQDDKAHPYPAPYLTHKEKKDRKAYLQVQDLPKSEIQALENGTKKPLTKDDLKMRDLIKEVRKFPKAEINKFDAYDDNPLTFKERVHRFFRHQTKKYTEAQIADKVNAAIKLVNLTGLERRNVAHLSGGQRQRVAIARAIVLRPKILLLDESLSALDLKLRKEMQYELKDLQRSTGITFIFVTHDQEEALTMSDKIVVLRDGKIEQVGSAEEIYNEPTNRYVANFIGDSNILSGDVVDDKHIEFDGEVFPIKEKIPFQVGTVVDVLMRPEDLDIVYPSKGKLTGTVDSIFFKGVFYEVDVKLDNQRIITIHTTDYVPVGKYVGVNFNTEDIHLMEVMQDGVPHQ